jgi:superfamily I DNA/RNA helicase
VFFGNEAISTKIVDKAPESGYTMIFRTNSALIEHGLDLILRGKKVNMHIDVSDFKSMMNSAYALAKNDMKNVKHQDIVPYVSWAEFCEEIGVVRNAELKRIHKFILDGRFHAIMDTLANYKRVDDPDVELISGHKSKGLEFDHVVLADDFEFHEIEDDGSWKGFSGQEQNLLYVAATRAKKSLKINDQIVGVQEYGRGRECGKSVKLEDAKIYKYESYMRAPSLNLMADVEQRMSEFGMIMTDLDHFIEGHPDSVSEHWENLEDGVPRFGN